MATTTSTSDTQFWATEITEALSILDTTQEGLSEAAAQKRLQLYGKNAFKKHEKKNPLVIFLTQFTSPLIFILIAAAITTAILREWVEVGVLTVAVFVNAMLGFYREYHAETTLEKLSTFIKDRSRVIRGGHEQEIDSELLVPGDIIKLSYGTRVPADARVLQAHNIRLDEAILTGESLPVQKSSSAVDRTAAVAERSAMVHAGSLVVEGFATALVTATGDRTEIGQIARLVSTTKRAKTPIQQGLSRLAWLIFGIVIVIVIGIFILGISRGESTLEMLVLSVAVAVGAVPEALPIALTVILSIGAERIARKRGITRTLIATETLGSTTVIMTDKTGTLTEADMRLVGVYPVDTVMRKGDQASVSKEAYRELLEMALSNVDVIVENPLDPMAKWTFKGKPFEVNIVKAAREGGVDIARLLSSETSPIVLPFNSTNKFSVSTFETSHIVMGAPDILLARSVVDVETYKVLESWITTASTEGKRLIALARAPHAISNPLEAQKLSFLGLLAFLYLIRKEVPEAVRRIELLGTRIVMVTGDLKGTALSVAREIGWNVAPSQVLTGHDLQVLSDEALLAVIPTIRIFARVTPEDKLRIGLLYRKLGEVVAMTGDGVNDAPSLKAMDIGVAIGSGSDVAKSAADLVLLDDNFKTITAAIQEGRRILGNIRKTFVYLMSNSLDEVIVIGGSLLLGVALPLTALQIIWVNLFTGSLPALAFAYDEDFDEEVGNKRRLKSVFTREVNVLTFGIGITSSILLFVLYYALIRYGIEISLARSFFFVCFASYILVIAYSFRSLRRPLFSYPVFSNRKLNQSILIAILILVSTMMIPALRSLFDLAPLPVSWLWFVVGWLALNVLLVEMAKYLFRRHGNRALASK